MTELERAIETIQKLTKTADIRRLSDVPNGGVYKMDDGCVLVKLRNQSRKALQDEDSAPGWAADLSNGQIISTMWQGETVEFLGLAYDLIFTA